MMRKTIVSIFIFLFCLSKSEAQQIADYTLYKENTFAYNPAVTGSEKEKIIYLTARKQWTKIKGSPFSANLAFHMPLKNEHIGLGGYFINDFTGPTSYTGINLSFAYHVILAEERTHVSGRKALSFGLSASAIQYRINGAQIKLDIPEDEAIYTYKGSQFYPDASFGIYYKSNTIKTGISIPQLLHLDIPILSRQINEEVTLRKLQHYYGFFSYKAVLNKKRLNSRRHYLEPAMNIHYVINAPFQGVASLRYNYDDVFFVELGYRSFSSMIFGAGVTISKQFSINYAYDFNISRTRANLGSVHELQLRFAFDDFKIKK